MEVFNVFTTMNLVDMISNPLSKIHASVGNVTGQVNKLSNQMAVLASSMLPMIAAAGVLLGAFGACTSSAMAFESAMADVAKVVNFTSENEFKDMSKALLDMSGKIPMATEGLAAITASAAQSNVAKQYLLEFTEQAAKMGVAFDLTGEQSGKMMADWRAGMALTLPETYALADAVNHLSNNMNATAPALGEVIQRVGSLGKQAGLAEAEVAALGATFLSSGASPEIASTGLQNFLLTLTQAESMTDKQKEAFESLGFSALDLAKRMKVDAKGAIFEVLNAVAKMPEYMHSSILTEMFGKESIKSIAPLLVNMGNLENAFALVADEASFAGSMQKEFEARSATAENAVILLKNKITALAISIGTYFLPFVSALATALGYVADGFRFIAESPIGGFLIEVLATTSSLVVALGAFGGAWWAIGAIIPKISTALSSVKMVFLGLSLPLQMMIGTLALLYIAYRTNFGGMADIIDSFFSKISLVFKGVITLFKNIENGSSSITGDLARKIEEAGLTEFITSLFQLLNRLKAVFLGVFHGITNVVSSAFSIFAKVLQVILTPVGMLTDALGFLITKIFGGFGSTDLGNWKTFGEILGVLLGGFIALATPIAVIVGVMATYRKIVMAITSVQLAWNAVSLANPLVGIVLAIIAVLALLVYYFEDIVAGAKWLIESIGSFFSSLLDGLLGGLSSAYEGITGFFSTIKQSITGFFSGINLYESGVALLSTFKDGIISTFQSLKDTVSSGLQYVRDLLPFSDAKEGPLSTLTLSGSRLLTTIGEGVTSATPNLVDRVQGALASILPNLDDIGNSIGNFFNGLFSNDPAEPVLNTMVHEQDTDRKKQEGNRTYTYNIENINLPNVENARDFIGQLEAELAGYGV